MLRYFLHRLALGLVVLFGLAVATFLIVHLAPGDPIRQALGPGAAPAQIAAIRREAGLDRPLPGAVRQLRHRRVTGNLGESYVQTESVGDLVGQRVAPSAILIAYGLLVAVAIGVPLAILAAVRPNGVADHGVRLDAMFSFAMPLFWLGLMLALCSASSSTGSRSRATTPASSASCGR